MMVDPDQAIGALFNGYALPGYGGFFSAVTTLGEAYLWLIVLAIVIFMRRYRKVAAVLIIVLLFSMVINEDIKDIVGRARPENVIVPGYFSLHSYAFPSGHTQTAFAIATVLSAFMPRRYNLITFLLAAAVGMSRIYLGYHYFTDVVGGAVAGIAIGSLAIYGMRRYSPIGESRPGAGRDRMGLAIMIIGFCVSLALTWAGKPIISLAAALISYIFLLYTAGHRNKLLAT